MKKDWKKWVARAVSAVLTASMTAAYLPELPAVEIPAAEVEAASTGTSYGGEKNPISDAAYAEFGLATNSPDEFDPEDESNPLEGFTTTIRPSELFVGYGNRTKSNQSIFFVADDVDTTSASALNLSGRELIGEDVDLDGKIYAMAECGADIDGDGAEEVVVAALRGPSTGSIRCYGYYAVYDYDKDAGEAGEWVRKINMSLLIFADDWANATRADSLEGLVSVTAGDFDGDGRDDVVLYMGDGKLRLLKYSEDFKYSDDRLYDLSMFDDWDNQFGLVRSGWYQEKVSLSTTSISGQDHLVVNISKPMKNDDGFENRGQASTIAIMQGEVGPSLHTIYKKTLVYGDVRMRFCSAVDADINGNGIDELVIGGYKNTGWSSNNDIGSLSSSKNLIQVITWNEGSRCYEEVWNTPVEVDGNSDLSVNAKMADPAALAAGRFHADSRADQVFLEGIVLKFDGASTTGSSEKDRLAGGAFSKEYKVPIDNLNNAFISTAAAGMFSTGDLGAEQLVLVAGDFKSDDSNAVFLDVIWVWENSDGKLTYSKTNDNYLNDKAASGSGSFLTVCAVDVDNDSLEVKYDGKTYGWSDPTLYCVLQSPPYWSELQYNSETYGAGEVSYSISYGTSSGTEGDFGISLGYGLEMSVTAGVSFLGNEAEVGFGFDASLMGGYVGSWGEEHAVKDTVKFIVAPGEDQAIVLAIPLVIYHYQVWIPEYKVTQEHLDNYNEMRKQAEAMGEKIEEFPYEEGDIVPGSWQDYDVQQTLDPAFSNISIETYNELAEKYHKELGLNQITEETFASKTIGDPSTYPSSVEELTEPGNVDMNTLHVSPTPVYTVPGESGKELAFEIEPANKKSRLN